MYKLEVNSFNTKGLSNKVIKETDLLKRMQNAALASALLVEEAVKLRLSQPGRGKIYQFRRGKGRSASQTITLMDGTTKTFSGRSGLHQSSSPGDSPAVFMGVLRASISHSKVETNGLDVEVKVGTKDPKSRWLEYGHRTNAKGNTRRIGTLRSLKSKRAASRNTISGKLRFVSPRPFWRPGVLDANEKVQERLRRI